MNRRQFLGLGSVLLFSGCLGNSGNTSDTTTNLGNSSTDTATSTTAKTSKLPPTPTPVVISPDTTKETQSTSVCTTKIPTPDKQTAIVSDPALPDITLTNETDERQTVQITVTVLSRKRTISPSERTTYEPLDLSEKPVVFSKTVELAAGEFRVYRCTDIDAYFYTYQVRIEVRNGPSKVFEYGEDEYGLDIGIRSSSIVRL